MNKALNAIKRFAADEDGTALMEYTVLLGMMVVAVIGVIALIGPWITGRWCTLAGPTGLNLSGAGMSACP